MAKVISILTQKGGVGKTTSTQHLGICFADKGANVLLIDLDPQGNLTKAVVGEIWNNGVHCGANDSLINGTPIVENVLETQYEGLMILPNDKLSKSGKRKNPESALLAEGLGTYTKLADLLSDDWVQQFDIVLIDNGPNLGLLSVNSLMAADYAIVPVKAEEWSIDGLFDTHETILQVMQQNKKLRMLGVFISELDSRLKSLNKEMNRQLEDFSKDTGVKRFKTEISTNSKFKTLGGSMKSIFQIKGSQKGAADYQILAEEIIREIEKDVSKKTQPKKRK